MTELIKKKLQEEISALEHELVHDLPKEIKKAAALGDLERERRISHGEAAPGIREGTIAQLGRRIADLSLINMSNIPKDKVGLGSTVRIYDSTKNEEVEYELVTSEETDAHHGKNLHHLSHWARAA